MIESSVDLWRFHAHEDRNTVAAIGLLKHLRQLMRMVDDEVIDAVDAPSGLDHRPPLHRMHEVDAGLAEDLAYHGDLGQRSGVEMADSARPQRSQDARMRIAFDGIEHPAR